MPDQKESTASALESSKSLNFPASNTPQVSTWILSQPAKAQLKQCWFGFGLRLDHAAVHSEESTVVFQFGAGEVELANQVWSIYGLWMFMVIETYVQYKINYIDYIDSYHLIARICFHHMFLLTMFYQATNHNPPLRPTRAHPMPCRWPRPAGRILEVTGLGEWEWAGWCHHYQDWMIGECNGMSDYYDHHVNHIFS